MKNYYSYARRITEAAMVAALYVILTILSAVFGMSSGLVQIRLSEMLVILPVFMPGAVAGLTVGCLIANLITGSIIWDIIFGTLATLIGAVGAYMLRGIPGKLKWLTTLPNIVANTLIISPVLVFGYGILGGLPYVMLLILVGEIISAGIFGAVMYYTLDKLKITRYLK